MYYYIVINGNKQPTPYGSIGEVWEAMSEIKDRLPAAIVNYVIE